MHTPRRGRAHAGRTAAAGVLLALSACATGPQPQALPGTAHKADMGAAATQPLQDFNIQKVQIPEVLLAARADPYRRAPTDCAALTQEVEALDRALGADLDIEPVKDRGLQGMELMEGAVRGLSTGWIPFRGVVRQVTGASAYARKVESAVVAGAIRRGYLKGVGERSGCKPPAAPVRTTAPTPPR